MRLTWSPSAIDDLARLHRFPAPKSLRAATQALRTLRSAARKLIEYPRMGETVDDEMGSRDIRRMFVEDYELRYEVRSDAIVVLRIWHTRENR
jgi:plasmid stabilization system protein ParE